MFRIYAHTVRGRTRYQIPGNNHIKVYLSQIRLEDRKNIAHEIEVIGAPFRGGYLNFMSSCELCNNFIQDQKIFSKPRILPCRKHQLQSELPLMQYYVIAHKSCLPRI